MPLTPERPLYMLANNAAAYSKVCDAATILRRTKEFWESMHTPMEKLIRNLSQYPEPIRNVIVDFDANVYPYFPASALVQIRAMCITADVHPDLWPVPTKKGKEPTSVNIGSSSSKAAGVIVCMKENPNSHNYGKNLPILIIPGLGGALKGLWRNSTARPLELDMNLRPECPFEVGNSLPPFSLDYYRKPTREEIEVFLAGVESCREVIFGTTQGG